MNFQTTYKQKIPKDWHQKFPVSNEKLQKHFSSVLLNTEIKVGYFADKPMTERRLAKVKPAARPKTKSDQRTIILVQCARFGSRHNIEATEWTMTVNSVPFTDVDKIIAKLESEGFERIIEWFKTTGKHVEIIGLSSLSISFNGEALIFDDYTSY